MIKAFCRFTFFALLSLTAFAAQAYAPSFYTSQSVLSSGKWVKIKVSKSGIHQISHTQLRAWGFANPSKVRVYGYGGVIPAETNFALDFKDDLPQTASMNTMDGRLLFYGEAGAKTSYRTTSQEVLLLTRNNFDNNGYYFLSDSPAADETPTQAYTASSNILDWHKCIDLIENEVQNPGKGGALYHDKKLSPGEAQRSSFYIRDFVSSVGIRGYFRYEMMMNTQLSTKVITTVSDNLAVESNPGVTSNTSSNPNRLFFQVAGTIGFNETAEKPLSYAKATFDVTLPASFAGSYAALDRTYINYPRYNRLNDMSQMTMRFAAPRASQNFVVYNAQPETQVWNITRANKVYKHALQYNATNGTVTGSFADHPSDEVAQLIAFQPSRSFPTPTLVGELQPANLHGAEAPEILIVTTRSNLEAAEELAQIHRDAQGMSVLVTVQDDIFNEFSSGAYHPSAVRRFIKMFKDRDPNSVRHLILYGRATYDPRALQTEPGDYLVTYEAETYTQCQEKTTNYASDLYFGMTQDNFNMSRIYNTPTTVAIGRIPAANAQHGRLFNDKIRRYLQAPPSLRQYLSTVVTSDNGNEYAHLFQANNIADALEANRAMTVSRADLYLFPYDENRKEGDYTYGFSNARKALEHSLRGGVGLMNYNGHGNEIACTGVKLYDLSAVNGLRYDRWPFALMATCDNFPHDRFPGNISEQMVLAPNGGAIVALGACRSVFLEHNAAIGRIIAQEYADAKAGTSMGEVYQRARNFLIDNSYMSMPLGYNTLSYNLCGDPALPVYAPNYKVAVDAFGSDNVATPLSKATVKARIVDEQGNTVEDFNGSAEIDIYDVASVRNVREAPAGSDYATLRTDDNRLVTLTVPVTNGIIDTECIMPEISVANSTVRTVFMASDLQSGLTAAGGHAITLGDAPEGYAEDIDTSAPVIEQMYIDRPDFVSGDQTGANVHLSALIQPSATGLAISRNAIKRNCTLTLDGSKVLTDALNKMIPADGGKMALELDLKNLKDGIHTITLHTINNAGNSSDRSISFRVVSTAPAAQLNVLGEMPVRSSVEIDFQCEESTTGNRLIITNAAGHTVLSTENAVFPYTWNCTDSNGKPLADGIYRAHALFTTDAARGATAPVEIVVVR